MSRLSNEQLFTRFRRHTDAAALGEVFDRTAEDLFKLALYLGPEAHDAEDLVQATYLTAIETAASFDAERKLFPWLLGILSNLARKARDRARRRIYTDRLPIPQGVDDPERQAEHSELQATLERAIARLPQPYRQVLVLHLGHGLNAQQISGVLERSAGTVRSQVVRGLEHLRRLLPAGLTGAAVLLAPGHVLAGVKAELLRAAETMAVNVTATGTGAAKGAAPGTGTTSGTATGPILGLGGLLLLVSSFWAFAPGPDPSERSLSTTDEPSVDAAAGDCDEAVAADVTPRDPVERRTPVVPAVFDVVVSVRCVGAAAPAGLWVELLPAMLDTIDLVHVEQMRPTRMLARTDDKGRATFRRVPPGKARCLIAGCVRHQATFRVRLGAANRVRLELPGSRTVSGRVLDETGVLRVGSEVWMSSSANEESVGFVAARTDAEGRFSLVATTEQVHVWATAEGRGPSELTPLTGGNHRAVELRLTADAGQLTCTVADARDRPVAGALVQLLPQSVGRRMFAPVFATTDAEGLVQLSGLPCGPAFVVARKIGFATATRKVAVRVGGSTAALNLPVGASIEGTIRRRNGKPWAGLALFAEVSDGEVGAHDAKLRRLMAKSDGKGHFLLGDLPPGPVRVRVVDTTQTSWVDVRRFDLGPGQRVTWNPCDAEVPFLHGRVVDQHGKPMGGYAIAATPSVGAARVTKYRTRVSLTDAKGRFHIRPLERGTRYHVAVFAPDRVPTPCSALAIAADCEPVRDEPVIEVHTDAAQLPVHGSVRDPSGTPVAVGKVLVRRLPFEIWGVVKVRDGAFGTSLPAGEFQFAYQVEGYGTYFDKPFEVAGHGVHRTVRLPARGRVALRVRGSTGGGRTGPRAGGPLRITIQDRIGRTVFKSRSGDTGSLACERELPPGEYVLRASQARAMPILYGFEVRADATTEVDRRLRAGSRCEFAFPYDPLDNTLDGQGHLHVLVRAKSGRKVLEEYLSARKVNRFDWVANLVPGAYRVEATSVWGGHAATAFHVPGAAGGKDAVVRVVGRLRLRR